MVFFAILDYSGTSIPKVQCFRTTAGRSPHSLAYHPTMVSFIEGMEVASCEKCHAASPTANLTQSPAEGSKVFHG